MTTTQYLLAGAVFAIVLVAGLAFAAYLLRHKLELLRFKATTIENALIEDLNAMKSGLVKEVIGLVHRLDELESKYEARLKDMEARLNSERSFAALKSPVRK